MKSNSSTRYRNTNIVLNIGHDEGIKQEILEGKVEGKRENQEPNEQTTSRYGRGNET